MGRVAILLVPVSSLALFLTSCASSDSGVVTEGGGSSTSSVAPVPGASVPDDGRLTPTTNGGVPGASVGW